MTGPATGAGTIPWRDAPGGIVLSIRLTPKSSVDAVEGVMPVTGGGRCVAARVRAVPEKGKANTALEKLIAGWLGVPRSTVSLKSGAASRLKLVHVAGDGKRLAALLRKKLVSD